MSWTSLDGFLRPCVSASRIPSMPSSKRGARRSARHTSRSVIAIAIAVCRRQTVCIVTTDGLDSKGGAASQFCGEMALLQRRLRSCMSDSWSRSVDLGYPHAAARKTAARRATRRSSCRRQMRSCTATSTWRLRRCSTTWRRCNRTERSQFGYKRAAKAIIGLPVSVADLVAAGTLATSTSSAREHADHHRARRAGAFSDRRSGDCEVEQAVAGDVDAGNFAAHTSVTLPCSRRWRRRLETGIVGGPITAATFRCIRRGAMAERPSPAMVRGVHGPRSHVPRHHRPLVRPSDRARDEHGRRNRAADGNRHAERDVWPDGFASSKESRRTSSRTAASICSPPSGRCSSSSSPRRTRCCAGRRSDGPDAGRREAAPGSRSSATRAAACSTAGRA